MQIILMIMLWFTVSKAFFISKNTLIINLPDVRTSLIFSTSDIIAWLVEKCFRKPNWNLYNIFWESIKYIHFMVKYKLADN